MLGGDTNAFSKTDDPFNLFNLFIMLHVKRKKTFANLSLSPCPPTSRVDLIATIVCALNFEKNKSFSIPSVK